MLSTVLFATILASQQAHTDLHLSSNVATIEAGLRVHCEVFSKKSTVALPSDPSPYGGPVKLTIIADSTFALRDGRRFGKGDVVVTAWFDISPAIRKCQLVDLAGRPYLIVDSDTSWNTSTSVFSIDRQTLQPSLRLDMFNGRLGDRAMAEIIETCPKKYTSPAALSVKSDWCERSWRFDIDAETFLPSSWRAGKAPKRLS